MDKKPKVFSKNADIKIVSESKRKQLGKDIYSMRIENEMLSRFNESDNKESCSTDALSQELDFFFENVMTSVVTFFNDEVTV